MNSQDQIEAAAIAIWREFTMREQRGKSDDDWARIPRVQKDRYRNEARAALTAALEVA